MREILYKKMSTARDRRKLMSIIERSEDKSCKTFVRKNFIYIVTKESAMEPLLDPEIQINKIRDSKAKVEKFSFRIKGVFYLTNEKCIAKVRFCHNLQIILSWKNKVAFPKPVTPP